MMPGIDGFTVCKKLREKSSTPGIIMLTAKAQEMDKVNGLMIGADDYITKPFGTGELLARVRAALRNSRHSSVMGSVPGGKFISGDLEIDYDRRIVSIGGNKICLTQTEYNIVALLSEHSGKVLTYAAIVKAVWGVSDPGGTKKLQVNMANIRKKLGVRPGEQKYILNELGVGYRMTDE